ncbi:hypothetical protein [Bdellovibrio bacteriovorus]|uniref:hypothetical protein n=1 Tax=Bdellovibrio bacteriovorus TaxID=959 RepID=UPI0035A58CEA
MKKVVFFLLIAFIAVSAYYNDKEGQADFASTSRTFTPIKLPALPKKRFEQLQHRCRSL